MLDLRRRQFITLLGGAAAAWPLAARTQQATKIPRIGIIDDAPRWNAFRHGLRDLGYLEGQNIAFDYSYGEGVPERLAEAANDGRARPHRGCWFSRPDLGERWPSRLVATAAEDRVIFECTATHSPLVP
jgi:hypothetical protein